MSKRIPKIIISFEHNYYLDEDVFKMVNKLEQENKQLKSILTELEEWIKKYIDLFDDKDTYEEGVEDTLKEVLDTLQELKEKYK